MQVHVKPKKKPRKYKTLRRYLVKALLLLAISTLLPGCPFMAIQVFPDLVATTGSLLLNFGMARARTLEPAISMVPAKYSIQLVGPASETIDLETSQPAKEVSKLKFGAWTVAVSAVNAGDIIIGQGSAVTTVHSGETQNLNIPVKQLAGYGSVDIEVLWIDADIETPSVAGYLVPNIGPNIDLSFQIATPGRATCQQGSIPVGYHSLVLQLLDNGVLVMGAVEVARIVKDQPTSGSFDFDKINPAGGVILIDITPEMNDPIDVTISGQQDVIALRAEMTVSASVPPDVGNVVTAWYINGESKATGASYTFGGDLDAGTYRLDATAFAADGKRAGSTSHTFQVDGSVTQVSLEWDPNTEPDLAGYKVYCGVSSGIYDTVYDAGNQTTYTITGLETGKRYYIAITAYNMADMESGYSDEVVFDA
jgi:hypothetical protein